MCLETYGYVNAQRDKVRVKKRDTLKFRPFVNAYQLYVRASKLKQTVRFMVTTKAYVCSFV